jgi:hypothetical protein
MFRELQLTRRGGIAFVVSLEDRSVYRWFNCSCKLRIGVILVPGSKTAKLVQQTKFLLQLETPEPER